jgi:hypothetical protein
MDAVANDMNIRLLNITSDRNRLRRPRLPFSQPVVDMPVAVFGHFWQELRNRARVLTKDQAQAGQERE